MLDQLAQEIQDQGIKFVKLRFTTPKGHDHDLTIPASKVNMDFLEEGRMFDGSSFEGWKGIQESDMKLRPDLASVVVDPFAQDPTLIIRCDVLEPSTMLGYDRDPRSIAKRAEAYLKSTGIADTAFFGPEPEFFIFDAVRYGNETDGAFYHIDSDEAAWNSSKKYEEGNTGHRPKLKGGYCSVSPIDGTYEVRAAMCLALEEMGIDVETHHHEVATAGQGEISSRFAELTKKADEVQLTKYVIRNVAHQFGKTVTFMPKPIKDDNGNGMHVHQSLAKEGKNAFSGDNYAGLSDEALYYIGGIIKHARALNAFTNPSTNSYKRLVPGFEAPVLLAYSARNRSAAIRIPHVPSSKARRIEVRFPDGLANPYLAFSAMLMAGLDGIKNKIHPGEAMDKDLYDLPPEELKNIPTVCGSLDQALESLENDMEFLLQGGVFSADFIRSYIKSKRAEVDRLRLAPHPVEFDMYYSG